MSERRNAKRRGSNAHPSEEDQTGNKWSKLDKNSSDFSTSSSHSQGDDSARRSARPPKPSLLRDKEAKEQAQGVIKKHKSGNRSSSTVVAENESNSPEESTFDEGNRRETRRSYQSYIENISTPPYAPSFSRERATPKSKGEVKYLKHGTPKVEPDKTSEFSPRTSSRAPVPKKSFTLLQDTPSDEDEIDRREEKSVLGKVQDKKGMLKMSDNRKQVKIKSSASKISQENIRIKSTGKECRIPANITIEDEVEREELSSPTRKSKRTPIPKKKFSLIEKDDLYVTSSESEFERDLELEIPGSALAEVSTSFKKSAPRHSNIGVEGTDDEGSSSSGREMSKIPSLMNVDDKKTPSGNSKRSSSRTPVPKKKFSLLDSDMSVSVSDGKTEVMISEISVPDHVAMYGDINKARSSSRTPVPKKEFLLLHSEVEQQGKKPRRHSTDKGESLSDDSEKNKKAAKNLKSPISGVNKTDSNSEKKKKKEKIKSSENVPSSPVQGIKKTKLGKKILQSETVTASSESEDNLSSKESSKKNKRKSKNLETDSSNSQEQPQSKKTKASKSQKTNESLSSSSANSPSVVSDNETKKGKKTLDNTLKIVKGKKGLLEMAKLEGKLSQSLVVDDVPMSSKKKKKGPVYTSSVDVAVTPHTSGKKSNTKEKPQNTKVGASEQHEPIILKLNTSGKQEKEHGKKEKHKGGGTVKEKHTEKHENKSSEDETGKKEHKHKGKHKEKKPEKILQLKEQASEQEHIVLKLSLSPKKKKAPKLKEVKLKDTENVDVLEPKHISLKIKKISDSDVEVSTSVTDTESGQTQVMESKVEHIEKQHSEGSKVVKKKKKKVHKDEAMTPSIEEKPAKKKKTNSEGTIKKPNVKIVIKKDKTTSETTTPKEEAVAVKSSAKGKSPAAPKKATPASKKVSSKSPSKPKLVTAYLLFCKKYRPKIVADNPGLEFSHVSKKVGELWNNLEVDEKQTWRERANELKAQLEKQGVPLQNKSTYAVKKESPVSRSTSQDGPVDALSLAAHLRLLGQSLSTVGACLKMQDQIEVHGSLSVLLDSALCGMAPLLFLTSEVPEMDGCSKEMQAQVLDNLAYVMPGLG